MCSMLFTAFVCMFSILYISIICSLYFDTSNFGGGANLIGSMNEPIKMF